MHFTKVIVRDDFLCNTSVLERIFTSISIQLIHFTEKAILRDTSQKKKM